MTERKVTPLPKAKKRKTPKSQTLTAQADAIFGRIIRYRGACEECGKTTDLQCAHGFSRRYRAVRWDEEQVFCLCRADHFRFTHNPLAWDEWMKERMGLELYEAKRHLALNGRNPDLAETVARLKERERNLESPARIVWPSEPRCTCEEPTNTEWWQRPPHDPECPLSGPETAA